MDDNRAPGTDDDDSMTIGSVEKALDILKLIKEEDGLRNVDIARRTGLSKGAVHKHLRTLHQAEFLTETDNVYRLSYRFLDFGEYVREGVSGASYIQEALRKLTEETNELAYFITEEHGRAVIVFRRQGRQSVNTQSRLGKRMPMHWNAGGKAILAHKSDEFINDMIEKHGLPEATENTVTEVDALEKELTTIREQGYALNREESSNGIRAVSSPVLNKDDEALGACSVLGPKYRFSGERFDEELPELLLTITNELSLNLKHA